MPTNNPKLTTEQRVTAIEWQACAEQLAHFLRGTPGHPELDEEGVTRMFDAVETTLLQLRRAFEKPADYR